MKAVKIKLYNATNESKKDPATVSNTKIDIIIAFESRKNIMKNRLKLNKNADKKARDILITAFCYFYYTCIIQELLVISIGPSG